MSTAALVRVYDGPTHVFDLYKHGDGYPWFMQAPLLQAALAVRGTGVTAFAEALEAAVDVAYWANRLTDLPPHTDSWLVREPTPAPDPYDETDGRYPRGGYDYVYAVDTRTGAVYEVTRGGHYARLTQDPELADGPGTNLRERALVAAGYAAFLADANPDTSTEPLEAAVNAAADVYEGRTP